MEKLRGMGYFEAINTFPRPLGNIGKVRGRVKRWEGCKLLSRKDLNAELPTIPLSHCLHTCTYRSLSSLL